MFKNADRNENRQFERITPTNNAAILIDIDGTKLIDIFKAGDISLGGIKILIAHDIRGCKINKQVKLAIKLPTPVNKSFSATGKIKHISTDELGLTFLSMHKKDLQMLRKYILFHQKNTSIWKSIRYNCFLY